MALTHPEPTIAKARGTATMTAAVVHSFTEPLAVERVPVPVPGPGEVLVEVEASAVEPVLRQGGEALAQPEFVEQVQGRDVHGVTPEVAEEVAVLLQDGDRHPRSGEQQTQEHAGGPTSDDRASRLP